MTFSFEPGRRWQYSGEGFMVLQAVIEAIADQDLASFMSSEILKPMGMHRSSLIWKDEYATNSLDNRPDRDALRRNRFRTPVAAASLYTTAADYAMFLSALLASQELLTQTTSAPVIVAPKIGIEWGYGWGIERSGRGINLWHWGNNPGFRSFAMISPHSGDGFVIFTSSDKGMALAVPLAHEVLPGEHSAFRFSMVG